MSDTPGTRSLSPAPASSDGAADEPGSDAEGAVATGAAAGGTRVAAGGIRTAAEGAGATATGAAGTATGAAAAAARLSTNRTRIPTCDDSLDSTTCSTRPSVSWSPIFNDRMVPTGKGSLTPTNTPVDVRSRTAVACPTTIPA